MLNLNGKPTNMNHIELGAVGENMAVQLLLKKQHTILKRNFRYRKGEIDIISECDQHLVATEVKTRETAQFGEPYMAVSRSKQRQIISVMNAYLDGTNHAKEIRFDVVSIVLGKNKTEIEHIENAFYPLV